METFIVIVIVWNWAHFFNLVWCDDFFFTEAICAVAGQLIIVDGSFKLNYCLYIYRYLSYRDWWWWMNEWMNDHDFLLWINRWYGRRPWWVFRDILGGHHQTHCWQGGWKRRGGAWQNNWGGEQFFARHWITYCRKLKISARLHNYYLEKLDKFQLDIFILSG